MFNYMREMFLVQIVQNNNDAKIFPSISSL